MNPQGSVAVSANVSENVIQLSFAGVVTAQEMAAYTAEIARALQSVQPGFSLLSDLTELEKMDVDCVPFIDKTMDMMKSRGVGMIVRVIPDTSKDIGMSIMSLFHYPRSLKIVTTETREEAAAVLRKTN